MSELLLIIMGICLLCILWCFIMLFSVNGLFGKRGQLLFGHNYKYNKKYDQIAQETFDNYKYHIVEIEEKDCYSIKFSNGVVFWTANKYYGYGQVHKIDGRDINDKHRISVKNALILESIENGTFERN